MISGGIDVNQFAYIRSKIILSILEINPNLAIILKSLIRPKTNKKESFELCFYLM